MSVIPHDGLPPIPPNEERASAYARHRLELADASPASASEVAAAQSSWAKRLRAGTARPVTLLRLRASLVRGDAAAQQSSHTLRS